MEKYIINGVEIDYDTFDMDSMDRYEESMGIVSEVAKNPQNEETGATYMRRVCESIMDFFDAVIGEGAATKIFGNRTNIKECFGVYGGFIKDVSTQMREFKGGLGDTVDLSQPNRAQRRAERK